MRCVLLTHSAATSQRPKACTSPATALYFSSKQTATAAASGWRASVEQVGIGGEGRRGGEGSNSHSAPLSSLPACATPLAGSLSHDTIYAPPLLTHRNLISSQRTQTVKGRRGEGSSTQLNTFTLCSPHFRPPVYYRHRVRGPQRSGFVCHHVVAVVVRFAPENISVYV